MENGKILYAFLEKSCVIKMLGPVVYRISPDFDRFLNKIIDSESIKSFIIDLTEVSYIDSTNLGILAKLYHHSRNKFDLQPVIVSGTNAINEMLRNVGFYKIFKIVEKYDEIEYSFAEVPHKEVNKETLGKVVLNAHKNLLYLDCPNKNLFKDIVTFLEDEIMNSNSPEVAS